MYHRNDEDDEWESVYFRCEHECPIPDYWSDSPRNIKDLVAQIEKRNICQKHASEDWLRGSFWPTLHELRRITIEFGSGERGEELTIENQVRPTAHSTRHSKTDWLPPSLSFLRAYSVTRDERDEKKKGDCTTIEECNTIREWMEGKRLGVGLWCGVSENTTRWGKRNTSSFSLSLKLTRECAKWGECRLSHSEMKIGQVGDDGGESMWRRRRRRWRKGRGQSWSGKEGGRKEEDVLSHPKLLSSMAQKKGMKEEKVRSIGEPLNTSETTSRKRWKTGSAFWEEECTVGGKVPEDDWGKLFKNSWGRRSGGFSSLANQKGFFSKLWAWLKSEWQRPRKK